MQPRHDSTQAVSCAAYPDRAAAEAVIGQLIDAGFRAQDIGILASDKGNVAKMTMDMEKQAEARETRTLGVGMGAGAAIGGTAGVLAGLGLLAVPGIGPLLAAGPIAVGIMGAISGLGIGIVAGSLVSYGIPRQEAQALEEHVKSGSILVTVHCGEDCEKAMHVFERSGGQSATCSLGHGSQREYS